MISEIKTKSGFKSNQKWYKEGANNIKDIIYTLRPILIVGQVFGVFRFSMKNNELLPTTGKMKCVLMCIVSVYSSVCVVSYVYYLPKSETHPLLDGFDIIMAVLVMASYIASFLTHSITKSQVNVKIILNLVKVDEKINFRIDNTSSGNNRCRTFTLCLFFFVLLTNLASSLLWYFQFFQSYYLSIFLMIDILYYFQDFETALVCIMVRMLKHRLTNINKMLEKQIKRETFSVKLSLAPKLRNLSLAYVGIGNICIFINDISNCHIFLGLMTAFMTVIYTLGFLLYSFRTEFVLANIIAVFFWSGCKLILVIVLSSVCESLLSTRGDTKDLVNALVMDYKLPPNARAQAKSFLELIDAWPLRIHVYDMFSVDISLLLKFITVSTTYLIILIQIFR